MKVQINEKKIVNIKRVRVNLKVRDEFVCQIYTDEDVLIKSYDGYVPDFMPGCHYGDYVELDIDAETGRILNWSATQKQFQEFMDSKQ